MLDETEKPKTSLAKYSAEFNDFAEPMRPKPSLRLSGRPHALLSVKRSFG